MMFMFGMLYLVLEDICKHEDRMLHAVEEQRCILTRVHDLEHELAVVCLTAVKITSVVITLFILVSLC